VIGLPYSEKNYDAMLNLFIFFATVNVDVYIEKTHLKTFTSVVTV